MTLTAVVFLLVTAGTMSSAFAQPNRRSSQRDPDRLSNKLERKVLQAVRDGDPERVAKLLRGSPLAFKVNIARAQTRAGLLADDPAEKVTRFEEAVTTYRDILTLQDDRTWFRGDARRVEVVGWQVEMGDVLLRHLIAPDLDRFEITSGLMFDKDKLVQRLQEARAAYTNAGELLDDLLFSLRTDEERFLLLGIADKIEKLDGQRRLNGAWATVYLGMIGGKEFADRANLLAESLATFDTISRTSRKPELKYNALLGAGVALREAGRLAEADSAFDRVKNSTAGLSLRARAMFENAKSLLAARRFREARSELDALASMEADPTSEDSAGGEFYIRLAPLIKAWAYVQEAKHLPPLSRPQQEELVSQGRKAFASIAARGGFWPDIVQVYEREIDDPASSGTGPTFAQLRKQSRTAMTEQDWAAGIKAFEALLKHADADDVSKQEARFNLGVCHFQLGHLRRAAEAFSAAAKDAPEDSAARAADYAYRCWRQVAADTKSREDYLLLAHAAELLAERTPGSDVRQEIEWVAALARQEAGDYASALTTYSRITRKSPYYWQARRNMARCRQSVFDEVPENASLTRRRRAAGDAIDAWTDLAERLQRVVDGSEAAKRFEGLSGPDEALRWISDAKQSAAILMANDLVRSYEEALELLETLKPTPRVLALQIRCHRGMGNAEAANRTLETFLKDASAPEFGSTLASLAADMENEIASLRRLGREDEARRVAADMAEILRQLMEWTRQHPDNERHVVVIQLSLAKTLRQAGKYSEAMSALEVLMQEYPEDGAYIREGALTQEEAAESPNVAQEAALNKAETLWAKLLGDPALRDTAPEVYWEARYHWLKHQLRHGRASEVAKAIDTERAWYPSLGGSPWQGKLLSLAAEARRRAPAASEPASKD